MEIIKFSSEFFNAKDTLECGQVFRYTFNDGAYTLISKNKCCNLYTIGDYTYIETDDVEYFTNYFDLNADYKKIYDSILLLNNNFLTEIASRAKGVRILKQDAVETAFSFIISQNNNIKRIQNSIEALCYRLGTPFNFNKKTYYSFPTVKEFVTASKDVYKEVGLGYRDGYVIDFANKLYSGYNFESLNGLDTPSLTAELLKIRGIGKKVADCITFFGFQRSDSFPVDTWIEKLYIENLNGKLKDRSKISKELVETYGNLSGYIQQYAFYYKRTLERG